MYTSHNSNIYLPILIEKKIKNSNEIVRHKFHYSNTYKCVIL